MKKILLIGLAAVVIAACLTPMMATKKIIIVNHPDKTEQEIRTEKIKEYLQKKESPLAEHADKLAEQKHWRMLIAISHIESSFCKRKVAFNCWGLGGDSNYQKYTGYDEAIIAADTLIEKFQKKGRWLTVNDMVGSYVVPGSPKWERTVSGTLEELKEIK